MDLEPGDAQRDPAVSAFIAELRHWREVAGCSQKRLSSPAGYTPSYVSKVERGTVVASRSFVESADQYLRAGRAIVRRWKEMHDALARSRAVRVRHEDAPGESSQPASELELVVDHEHAP